MATSPIPSTIPDAVKQFFAQLQISANVTLPGELIAVALINAWIHNRDSMSQANRDDWDALLLRPATRFIDALDKLADTMGIPK